LTAIKDLTFAIISPLPWMQIEDAFTTFTFWMEQAGKFDISHQPRESDVKVYAQNIFRFRQNMIDKKIRLDQIQTEILKGIVARQGATLDSKSKEWNKIYYEVHQQQVARN